MAVIQAQDVVNAVIQDSQIQTTNRNALYDYTDRIHQRILRESQWRFLLSDPLYFSTVPGVSGYNLTNGTTPSGAFNTPLGLTDFKNIAPGTVFNATSWSKIEEDPDTVTTLNSIINRDGSLRTGFPRTYANSIANPGTIYLKPAPDGQNFYYPVPETPVVNQAPLMGCLLGPRVYYGVVTFVDAFGGESTPSVVPFTIAVLPGNVITVKSPMGLLGSETGNQMMYIGWNLYIGYQVGSYYRQNVATISIGSDWTEPTTGITPGQLQVPSLVYLPPASSNATLAIHSNGNLTTTVGVIAYIPTFWAIRAPNGSTWQVTVDPTTHVLITLPSGSLPSSDITFDQIYLNDLEGVSTWKITVQNSGILQSEIYTTPPSTIALNSQPPATATIQPLNSYIIQFRYYKLRNKITNPTDVLQIPYEYKDIVVSGVNYYAALYANQGKGGAANPFINEYKAQFEAGLAQIRRDLRISFRKTDYIGPDITTQYVVANQQGIPTMGW